MPPLADDEIHVWVFSLDPTAEDVRCYGAVLSEEERARAARFLSESARWAFVAAHGMLREILGGYCGRKPGDLSFASTGTGKPVLKDEALNFNLSHSHGGALAAVSKTHEVGVDLELVRERIDCLKLAERFFSQEEHHCIARADAKDSRSLFFRYWVCKEAALKARGVGLRMPLRDCVVTWSASADGGLVRWPHSKEPSPVCAVRLLPLGEEWVGAVAAEGERWRPQVYRVPRSVR